MDVGHYHSSSSYNFTIRTTDIGEVSRDLYVAGFQQSKHLLVKIYLTLFFINIRETMAIRLLD